VVHRSKFSRISGVDFTNHSPDKIAFIPPESVLPEWETDYNEMKENMIYGEALSFNLLLEKLKVLQNRLNTTKWD
jgi:hypothetical protein